MDLALALGRDVSSMPEREFSRWRMYMRRKALPFRRIEFYLAHIAMLLAQSQGAENVTIPDFLFEPERDDDGCLIDQPEVDPAEAARAAFAFNPRK